MSGTSITREFTFSYAAAGQLTSAADPDSSDALGYDRLGRVATAYK